MLTAPGTLDNDQLALWDVLTTRLVALDERVWDGNANGPSIVNWLGNFVGRTGASRDVEQLHALYLLSQFMYFGSREIRVLLKALYRELFLMPLAQKVRASSSTEAEFAARMDEERAATRFLGVGNPSESGVHLLYYFRQENLLSKDAFLDSAQIYKRVGAGRRSKRLLRYTDVKRYVFLDDMCGSGETAVRYSTDLLPDLLAAKPAVEVSYFALFATEEGLDRVRNESAFGQSCGAVYELDRTFKWNDPESRYRSDLSTVLDSALLSALAATYGSVLWPGHPLGYMDGQLLLGFSHNTPDNTLPLIWCDQEHGAADAWCPIFRRYPKV